MDEYVKQKLVEWGLEDLQENFQKNQIDEEIFKNLEEKDIQELIPILGLRKKFLSKYHTFIHVNKCDSVSTLSDSASTLSEHSSTNESLTVIPNENRATSFYGAPNFSKSLGRDFPDFNLKTLLKTSAYGKTIVGYYKQHNILDDTNRSRLVDVIIKHIYDYIITHRLKHDQYTLLCGKITDLFPRESASTYYIPYIPKREARGTRGILAKGRLVDKARNLLYQSGDTVKCKSKRKLDGEAGEGRSHYAEPGVEPDERIKESITFLKHFKEPWDEVVKHWKETANLRKNSQKHTVEEFLSEWPILTDLRAEQLINLDFEFFYGKCGLNLLNNWGEFIDTIIRVAGTTKIRDKEIVSNYSEIFDNKDSSDDTRVFSQIGLLCHMIPPKGRIKISKNDSWKFTILECLESIIILSSTAGDVEKSIAEQKQRALLRKQQVQPYLLVVGTSFRTIQSVFVVVDTIRYQFNSVLKGLDTLFKIFHVFNANYPVQSEHIWTLVQKALFKITTRHDKEFPYIMYLLKAFEEQ